MVDISGGGDKYSHSWNSVFLQYYININLPLVLLCAPPPLSATLDTPLHMFDNFLIKIKDSEMKRLLKSGNKIYEKISSHANIQVIIDFYDSCFNHLQPEILQERSRTDHTMPFDHDLH